MPTQEKFSVLEKKMKFRLNQQIHMVSFGLRTHSLLLVIVINIVNIGKGFFWQ